MNKPLSQDLLAWNAPHQQAVFRQLMRAFSYPGRIETLADGDALTQTLATLVDSQATLADPQNLMDTLTHQRLQARMTASGRAQFVVANGCQPPSLEPCLGTLESPERGATILLKVTTLGEGACWQLTGPGIAGTQRLTVTGLHPEWLTHRQVWNDGFPLGVDMILMDATRVAALPRTTSVTCVTAVATQGDAAWAM
ncbi:MAG: phosphonate C-P lyase system protein PhnH [Rhodoferax sp.]|nr:phosphonate C-P lyase system protein PhnH [Rhodoferax sp.]